MKRISLYILILMLSVSFLSGCAKNEVPAFANTQWSRNTETDTEYIRFDAEGNFSYYCACGNAVDNSDVCNGYTYKNNVITLKFDGKNEKIIVKEHTKNKLTLDFSGDVRTFVIPTKKVSPDSREYEGETYVRVQYPDDIFTYNFVYDIPICEVYTATIGDCTVLMADEQYVKEEELDKFKNYLANHYIYDWSATITNAETEETRTVHTLNLIEDLEALHTLGEGEPDRTIFFEDITSYAFLKKDLIRGLVSAEIELVWIDDTWYWRSGEIDESAEGWPEYIYKIPDSVSALIGNP